MRTNMTKDDRHQRLQEFLKEFPLDSLPEMPIERYTNLNRSDSFCYWVESKTYGLGSIWGGSSYKFGIFMYKQQPSGDNSKPFYDDTYAWYSRHGSNAKEVYQKVRDEIVKIATYASEGRFDEIDQLDTLGPVYKWKVAFLYSNEQLIPIYSRDMLTEAVESLGMEVSEETTIPEMQRFLMDKKGSEDLFQYYDRLLSIIKDNEGSDAGEDDDQQEDNPIPEAKQVEEYSRERFLEEVYMEPSDYDDLVSLLKVKKNIILQGAPGVGKTFAAKRLAYSILGGKDDDKIEMVQFHQNYSYEDFVMGYKPTADGGFELKTGVFHNFCRRAKSDPDNDYFFIIDEINRGNLSKIFGELLMLIENNYRGESIQLAYTGEDFTVPENVYIIGMMNTADRSLAMIDYALRRRFSFFDMSPAFGTDRFKEYQTGLQDETINKVIDAIVSLNKIIESDDSLGAGFCIGHSYFCNHKKEDAEWLPSVIKYDIAPMLREYWFDDPERSKAEIATLEALIQ